MDTFLVQIPGFPPAPLDRFHGRDRELWILEHALRRPAAVLIHAFGGMGKTALTRAAAHWWIRTGCFAHAIFHSFEQGAGAEAVVRLIGESLGGEDFLHLSPDAQWARAVRLFRETSLLLVWDNYESVLPAFSSPAGSAAPAASALVGSAVRTESGTDHTGEGPHSGPYEPFDDGARADLEQLYRELTEGQPRGRLADHRRPGLRVSARSVSMDWPGPMRCIWCAGSSSANGSIWSDRAGSARRSMRYWIASRTIRSLSSWLRRI